MCGNSGFAETYGSFVSSERGSILPICMGGVLKTTRSCRNQMGWLALVSSSRAVLQSYYPLSFWRLQLWQRTSCGQPVVHTNNCHVAFRRQIPAKHVTQASSQRMLPANIFVNTYVMWVPWLLTQRRSSYRINVVIPRVPLCLHVCVSLASSCGPFLCGMEVWLGPALQFCLSTVSIAPLNIA